MDKPGMIREMVGVFHDFVNMQSAISKLQTQGFERHDISVLGNEKQLKENFGRKNISVKQAEDHPDTPRSANVEPENIGIAQGVLTGIGTAAGVAAAVIASGGTLIPGLAIAAVAAGGIGGFAAGGALAKLLGDKYADFYKKQLDKGGILVWVRTSRKIDEDKAREIFKEYGADDIHVHDIKTET